jgi:predicted transcriptional regulator
MKEDYAFKTDAVSTSFKLEKEVAETIKKMAEYTKISESEMVNTAVKRFIATHSDFLPPRAK